MIAGPFALQSVCQAHCLHKLKDYLFFFFFGANVQTVIFFSLRMNLIKMLAFLARQRRTIAYVYLLHLAL